MSLIEHYQTIHSTFMMAAPGTWLAACGVCLLCGAAITLIHEFAHLGAARCFGLKGRLAFFALRGKSRVWFLSIMAANFDDAACLAAGPTRLRITAAAGPVCHTSLTLLCLYAGLSLPGPAWLSLGIALTGALYMPISLINFVPLPFGTDGWRFMYPIPKEMLAENQAHKR